jgi:hypothetical protein
LPPSIAEERHHLPNKLLRAVRLLEETPGRGEVCGIARGEEHAHVRPVLARETGGLEAVEARHDDIGEEEADPRIALEEPQGRLAVGGDDNLEPFLLEHGDRVFADIGIVIDDQDFALAHQPSLGQPILRL